MQKLKLSNRRGQNVVGILTQPEGEIRGTAVLQHGYGGVKEQKNIQAIKGVFLKHNFQVFNFDSPNSIGESDGVFEDARQTLHAEDFDDVTNWVQEQEWFKGELAVSGPSMGGFASARYALRNPKKVSYVIPIVPVVSGELILASQRNHRPEVMKAWEEKGYYERPSKINPSLTLKSPWAVMLDYIDNSLLTESNSNPPMLLISAALDNVIPPQHVQIFADGLTGDVTHKIIDDSGHYIIDEEALHRLEKIVDTWLTEKLR